MQKKTLSNSPFAGFLSAHSADFSTISLDLGSLFLAEAQSFLLCWTKKNHRFVKNTRSDSY